MKRKVQAQRKFAQGAYIPPTNVNLPIRGDHAVTPTKEDRSIVHHNVAAKTLLDTVSFQSIHPHAEPRVLLKRLSQKETKNTPSEPPDEPVTIKTTIASQEKPVETHNYKESKIRELKSNGSPPFTAQPRIYKTRRAGNAKFLTKLRSATTVTQSRKRVLKRESSSDFDDETPLKHLKSLAKLKNAPYTNKESLPETEKPTISKEVKTRRKSVYPSIIEKTTPEKPSTYKKPLGKIAGKKSQETRTRVTRLWQEKNLEQCVKKQGSRIEPMLKTKEEVKNKKSLNSDIEVTDEIMNNSSTTSTSKAPADTIETNRRPLTEKPSTNHVYLDLLPRDSPHVIQLTSEKTKDQNKQMMKARLIPKSEANSTQDYTVVKNEPILGLLPTFNLDVVADNNKLNFNEIFDESSDEWTEPLKYSNSFSDTSFANAGETSVAHAGGIPVANAGEISVANAGETSVANAGETSVANAGETSVANAGEASAANAGEASVTNVARAKRPIESSSLLHGLDEVKPLEAPTFYLTEKEFDDPIAFFEKIAPTAAKYGVCKIVAPQSYKPNCVLDDDISFHVTNQYIGRLYSRWGSAMREMCAIKANLASQNIPFRSPLLEGLELNLPKLHRLVQRNGGLSQVLELKRWNRVAEEMRVHKSSGHNALDRICMRTLLPYDTLSTQERQQLLAKVEKGWNKKNQRLMQWAINPLHRQKKLLGDSDSSEEETEEDPHVAVALKEAEDCIVKGKNMTLTKFKKVAASAKDIVLGPGDRTCTEIEEEYWRVVLFGTEHVGVYTASIDTGVCGYGFPRAKTDPSAKHPWNLKMVSQNSGNVLRSLGMVLGATVPTLHLGMVFSTSCWHRDPHGLPWLEYMHAGPPKIWYGIPDEESANFRKAVETLCPTSCQNKSIWLPSDITMIPPELLRAHGVALARVEQNPGEYIMVFPKAYSCSISTGYTVSESVYFATDSWLKDVVTVFQELRESCEPTTFSLEQLLMSLAMDARSSRDTLLLVRDSLARLLAQETIHRVQLQARGLSVVKEPRSNKNRGAAADAWNGQEECEVCRTTLYLSKVTYMKGHKSAVCPEHALRLLDTQQMRGFEITEMKLVTMFTQRQLDQALEPLQRIAQSQIKFSSSAKSSTLG